MKERTADLGVQTADLGPQTFGVGPWLCRHRTGERYRRRLRPGGAPDSNPAIYRRVGTDTGSRPVATPETAPQPPIPLNPPTTFTPSINLREHLPRVRIWYPRSEVRSLTPDVRSLILHNLQIIGDRKHAGYAIRPDISDVLVTFIVHYAFEGHFPAFHDNPDRLLHSQRIFL